MVDQRAQASFELLLEISRELASSLDLGTVLARILFLSTENVGAERGSLIVMDEEGEPVEAAIVITETLYRPTVAEMKEVLEHGLAGWVATHHQAVLVNDISQDERWVPRADDREGHPTRKSAICVPLMAQERLVGILTLVHREPGFFGEHHLRLLQTIADLAALAVRNAQLYRSIEVAQQRYRELFEDSIDPILITTLDRKIVEVNRRAVQSSGYAVEQLIGRVIDILHTPDESVQRKAVDQVEALMYEGKVLRRDGSEFPAEVYVRRVSLQGRPYLQWMFRDITERKALDALREDLTAMIYHDLRSPLANIISSFDLMNALLPMQELPNIQPIFQIAMRSADRLQRLVSSLLDINRLEAGQPIMNREPVQPLTLIQEALEVIRPLVESKQQTLDVKLPSTLPSVLVDADMIRRVIVNLLENAVKYTPSGGALQVGAIGEDEQMQIWVQDSGPGIAPEYHQVIFEKFSRLQGERFPGGLGLGLAFCRLAVQAHGGKIWVESKSGQGSRFIFTLPIFRESGANA